MTERELATYDGFGNLLRAIALALASTFLYAIQHCYQSKHYIRQQREQMKTY
jgi:hypothetical protein